LRYAEVSQKELKFLDMTSLTVEEFKELVPAFEKAYQQRMEEYCLDGKKRTGRRYSTYRNCPFPTAEDRLFFILVYLKTHCLQVVHGELFGMGQQKANQWIHALLPVLQAALRDLGDAPARDMEQLGQRLGVTVSHEDLDELVNATEPAAIDGATAQPAAIDGATAQPAAIDGATAQPAAIDGATAQPAAIDGATVQPAAVDGATVQPVAVDGATVQPVAVDPPLFAMMEPSGVFNVPKTLMSRKRITAGRKNATPSRMCS
jgi:Helix-turn-helix of DDE superfamily endonuclease